MKRGLFILAAAAVLVSGSMGFAGQLKVEKMVTIADFGKSVDWSLETNRIASARLGEDGYYDVFTMNPDGGDIRVLTEAFTGCPQKHNGNPCFHPSGKFLVFTGENEQLPDEDKDVRRLAVPGSGLGANLFIVGIDGRSCHQLTRYPLTPPIRAVIHPQFSKNGKKLAWAERVRKGQSFGGGWVIRMADFIDGRSPRLLNIKTLAPGEEGGFYEVHDFSRRDERLLFSGNLKKGQPHTGLDIYEMQLASGKLTRFTHTDTDWDEHAHYSPKGDKIAWMSSAGLEIDYGPEKGRGTTWSEHLKTELWVMEADGSNARQLTHFNTPGHRDYTRGVHCIVSDSTWAPDGRSLLVCVALFRGDYCGVKLVRIDLRSY